MDRLQPVTGVSSLPSIQGGRRRPPCSLEEAIRSLVDAAQLRPSSKQKFATYPWKTMEKGNINTLKSAIHATLGYMMRNAEAEIIMSRFRTHENTFDYSAFLVAFLDGIDNKHTPVSSAPYPSTQRRSIFGSKALLFKVAKHTTQMIRARFQFTSGAISQAQQRALHALEEALRVRIMKRLPDPTVASGNIQRSQFQIALRNLYNIRLSDVEADVLFGMIDANGDDVISNAELTSTIQRISLPIQQQIAAAENAKRRNRLPAVSSSYDSHEFQRAVVLLTESLKSNNLLQLSDSNLSQAFVRKRIFEQIGVKLTRLQLQCLCYKLQLAQLKGDELFSFSSRTTATDSTTTDTDTSIRSTDDFAAAMASASTSSGEENLMTAPINGKLIELFYAQLKRYFGSNKNGGSDKISPTDPIDES